MQGNRQHLSLIALAIALQLPLSACGPDLTSAQHIQRGQQLLQQGELKTASIEASNALQKEPNSAEGRWLMARISLELGDAVRAESDIRKAMQHGLPRSTGQFALAQAILQQQDIDRLLIETATLAPNMSNADKALLLGLRGQAVILKGLLQDARPILVQALALDPRAVTALVGSAIVSAAEQDYEQARKWIARALEAAPSSPEAWSILGDLELTEGNAEAAEQAFVNVLKHRKYPSVDRAKLALARTQLKKFAEAESDINTLRQQGWKGHPYVEHVAGLISFSQGKLAQAATSFEASFNVEPGNIANRMYLATTKFMLGQTEQALSHAEYVHANAPGSSAAKRLLGAIQINRMEYSNAKATLLAALAAKPEDQTALRMLTTIALLERDGKSATEFARRLVALDPRSAQAQEMLASAQLISGIRLDASPSALNMDNMDDYSREFVRALSAFQAGRPDQALLIARRLQEQHPDRIEALNLISICYLVAGHWEKGKAELEKVLALSPNEPSAARNLAQVEILQGNLDRARTVLDQLLAADPRNEPAALLLAEVNARSGNLPEGIRTLETLLRNNPTALEARQKLTGEYLRAGNLAKVLENTRDLSNAQLQSHPELLEMRGQAQLQSGELASARSSFEQLTRLAPQSAAAHFHLSDSLARAGDAALARKMLERSLQLDPKYLPARIGEIKLRVQAGDVDKARAAVSKLKADFGERPEVLGIEGWFALGTGDAAAAERHLAAALKQRPETETAILLSRALVAQKKLESSQEVLEEWLKQHPRDLIVLLHLAGGYLSQNRNDQAISTYTRVIEHYPDHAPSLNNLAWLNRDKDPKRAMDYANQARRLAPNDPYVLDTLGQLALNEGDAGRALGLLREAARHAPAEPEIQLHLAAALIKQERLAEAEQILTPLASTLASKLPDSPLAREAKTLLDAAKARKR